MLGETRKQPAICICQCCFDQYHRCKHKKSPSAVPARLINRKFRIEKNSSYMAQFKEYSQYHYMDRTQSCKPVDQNPMQIFKLNPVESCYKSHYTEPQVTKIVGLGYQQHQTTIGKCEIYTPMKRTSLGKFKMEKNSVNMQTYGNFSKHQNVKENQLAQDRPAEAWEVLSFPTRPPRPLDYSKWCEEELTGPIYVPRALRKYRRDPNGDPIIIPAYHSDGAPNSFISGSLSKQDYRAGLDVHRIPCCRPENKFHPDRLEACFSCLPPSYQRVCPRSLYDKPAVPSWINAASIVKSTAAFQPCSRYDETFRDPSELKWDNRFVKNNSSSEFSDKCFSNGDPSSYAPYKQALPCKNQDYSKFVDDDFDVKEWVNAAFRAHKEGSSDQYATTLVMKLQMFMQEVNNVIEDSCQQAVTNLPRVTKELDAVRQEATMLQEQMKMVKYDIQKVEHDTAQSMQTLLKLDTVKGRMKLASDALREADNWTTLSADVEEVFESRDIDAISKKIIGMQQSLHILTDVPDYVERCQYLETLKNRLEAMLSPHVVTAFSSHSLDSAQKFAKIFTDIERLSQLCKYYYKCHKGNLQETWKLIQAENPDHNLASWLTEFYNQLLTVWQSQVKWCAQVFPDPVLIACDLLTETLTGLDPPLTSYIDTYIDSNAAGSPVEALINIRKIVDRFVAQLEMAIDVQHLGPSYLPCIEKLAAAIYSPFKQYTRKFGQFEQTSLGNTLDNIRLDHPDVLDSVNLLAESVSKLFAAATAANNRCIELTSGCGYIVLPGVLQGYFEQYLNEFQRVVVNVCEKCKFGSATVDSDEWSAFQNSLRLIQTCGDLIMHVDELDQLLVTSIVNTIGKYCLSTSQYKDSPVRSEIMKKNPFRDYRCNLLASDEDRHMLGSLVVRLEEGDNPTVLDSVKEKVFSLSVLVHKFSFDTVFAPLQQLFAHVPNMQVWQSENTGSAITSNLPSFSLAPQEYITKVGQYLMTLPQQLEPFTAEGNLMMTIALKHGKLPYTGDIADLPKHLADLWLESVARGSMHVYTEQILKIHELTEPASKQLVTDIDYLMNVLDDLGLKPSDTMKTMVSLLQASHEQYTELAENCPQRLSSAIANMRGIRTN